VKAGSCRASPVMEGSIVPAMEARAEPVEEAVSDVAA